MTENGMSEPQDEFSQGSVNFVEWFQNLEGCRLSSKIKVADFRQRGAGRGIVALQDVAEDEELFAVARKDVLTTTTSSVPREILEPLRESGNWPPLIVTIIWEYLRGQESPWYPYFQVLPTTFETLMFWKPTELAQLQASAVANRIGKVSAEENWKSTIIPVMKAHPEHFLRGADLGNDEEFIRLAHMAGSLIMSYAFDIDTADEKKRPEGDDDDESEDFEEDDEDEPVKGMVPFADMLNADADRNNARLFQEDDYLIMKATKPIAAGEEIFNDYGPLPRSDLLRMYGYVTDNYSKYDVIEFEHSLLEEVAGKDRLANNPAWLKKREALDELGLIDDGYSLSRPEAGARIEDVLPGQLHMLLRALCTPDSSTKMPKLSESESVSIDEAALLSSVLTKKLSEYETSTNQDTEILGKLVAGDDVEIPTNVHRNRYEVAIKVRRGEKEVLQSLIKLCQDRIERRTRELAAAAPAKRKHENDYHDSRKSTKSRR